MQAQKVILGGNSGEAMQLSATASNGNNDVIRWIHDCVVAFSGELPTFSWSHRPDKSDFDLDVAWMGSSFRVEKGQWIVFFDAGGWWVGANDEFESGVTFVANTKSSALDRAESSLDKAMSILADLDTSAMYQRNKTDGFGFSAALMHLKDGGRVARAGWNGKGMWLVLVHYSESKPHPNVQFSVWSNDSVLDALTPLPWIGMSTADGGFVPWLASQTDMLAEDWQIVE